MNTTIIMERKFSKEAEFFLGKKTIVYIKDMPSEIAYTLPPKEGQLYEVYIYISCNREVYAPATEEECEIYEYGALGHEMLHHKYSPFTAEQKVVKSLPKNEQPIFHLLWNVGEDPAIEGASDQIYGGMLEKALLVLIQHTYDVSPAIDEGVQEGDIRQAFRQVVNALIQLGDRGPVKGKFQTPEAEQVFHEVEPVFWKMVKECDGIKRIELAKEMFELTRPLWSIENAATEIPREVQPQMQSGGEGQNLPQRNDCGSDGCSENAEQQTGDGKADGENSRSEKKEQNARKGKSGNEKADSSTGRPDWFTPGNGAGGKRPEITEEDLRLFREELKKAEAELRKQEEAEAERKLLEKADIPANNDVVTHRKMPAMKSLFYDTLVEQYRVRIQALTRELKAVFCNDTGAKKNSEHGAKIGVKRISDGKLHTKIMVSRSDPKNVKDLAVYLLVDESGSMRGEKILCARDTAICLYEALSALNIPVAITGFSTEHEAAHHEHFVTWHSSKDDKSSLLRMSASNCNYDYWSIAEAAKEIEKAALHKILIVVSDGAPCTCQKQMVLGNAADITKSAIEKARKRGIDVLGVAIRPVNRELYAMMYGKDFIVVNRPDDMFLTIAGKIKKIVQMWTKENL